MAVAKSLPPLSVATRMSWPAPKAALREEGWRSLAEHTVVQTFFTGKLAGFCAEAAASMRTTDERLPCMAAAGAWNAAVPGGRGHQRG